MVASSAEASTTRQLGKLDLVGARGNASGFDPRTLQVIPSNVTSVSGNVTVTTMCWSVEVVRVGLGNCAAQQPSVGLINMGEEVSLDRYLRCGECRRNYMGTRSSLGANPGPRLRGSSGVELRGKTFL